MTLGLIFQNPVTNDGAEQMFLVCNYGHDPIVD